MEQASPRDIFGRHAPPSHSRKRCHPAGRQARCVAIMAQNNKPDSIGKTDDELERWRRAAEDALQQLDWAIGYLHGIALSRPIAA